ncbi:MAG: 6-phosphogluconolactonase [Paracoccaceae bacterium]
MPDFMHYPDRTTLMENLAEDVAAQLADVLEMKGKATLVVPGGTTPSPFLKLLSKAPLAWKNITVMLSDERFVPESSPRSNTRLIRETLLQNTAAAARFIPLYKPAAQPEDVLDDLAKNIARSLPIDVCVLGMGADMHTASLFPQADRLAEALDPETLHNLLPMRASGADEPRLTLTAKTLRSAKHIHILLTGADKKTALEQALIEGPATQAPVRAILNAPANVEIHYAD